jgi:hypothetical protein
MRAGEAEVASPGMISSPIELHLVGTLVATLEEGEFLLQLMECGSPFRIQG